MKLRIAVARSDTTPDIPGVAALHDAALSAGLSRLPRLGDDAGLISAVSGGADSMALAVLTDRFARRLRRPHRAIIIDHGLRAESADEAAQAAACLAACGIPAEIHAITAAGPSSGIQEWARTERYNLLCAVAMAEGAVLLTGHHADDQVETINMRLQRGSGLGGLAGIRGLSFRQGVAVLRPLLALSHAALVDLCRHWNVTVASDPSNSDRRFERVRIRQELGAMRALDMAVPDQLARLAAAAAVLDDTLHAALDAAGLRPQIQPAGYAACRAGLLDLPDAARHRVLAWLVSQIGNARARLSMAAASRLADRIASGRPATVGGCRFLPHDGGWLTVAEPGRVPPVRQIASGQTVIFADRWRITSPQAGFVRYLGASGSGAAGAWKDAAGWCALASPVRRALPVIETLDGDLLYPHLNTGGNAPERPAGAWAECLSLRGQMAVR